MKVLFGISRHGAVTARRDIFRYVVVERFPNLYSRHSSGGRYEARTARQSTVVLTLTIGVINATLVVQTDEIK